MNILLKNLIDFTWENPIFSTELRRNLRQNKMIIIQTIYLAILSIVLYMIWGESARGYYSYDPAYTGKNIFNSILFLQYLAISLLCPAFTCADISSEMEKKTFDLLITSLLNSKEIIMGKLNSTLTFIGLLLITSVPVITTVFYFGGVSPLDIFIGYLFIFSLSIFYSMIGLYMSARVKKTTNSIVLTYAVIMILFIFSGAFFDRFFSPGSNSGLFTLSLDFYLFKLPFWSIYFFEVISISIILFLSASNLIETPAPRKSKIVRILISLYFVFNIFLITMKWVDYVVSGGYGVCSFYQYLIFIFLVVLPFFIWPGETTAKKLDLSFGNIFRSGNNFSQFFIPFVLIFSLIISGIIFLSYSLVQISLMATASTIVFLLIFLTASGGRWLSNFFEKEDSFIVSILSIVWLPIIVSFIIRKVNSSADPSLLLIIVDPFLAVKEIFNGSSALFAGGITILIYVILSIVFQILTGLNLPGKKS